MNTNAKTFTAETIGETLAIILGTVKALDSASSCVQRDDFQTCCEDRDCPRCNMKTLAVSTMKGTTAIAVTIKDLADRLPHCTLDDGVTPAAYRESYYGNFPFTTLDRREFKDRRGKSIF